VFLLDLEQLLGAAREHVEFTLWYLQQKQLVERTENSRLAITAAGVNGVCPGLPPQLRNQTSNRRVRRDRRDQQIDLRDL
jgi:hypothetical protein